MFLLVIQLQLAAGMPPQLVNKFRKTWPPPYTILDPPMMNLQVGPQLKKHCWSIPWASAFIRKIKSCIWLILPLCQAWALQQTAVMHKGVQSLLSVPEDKSRFIIKAADYCIHLLFLRAHRQSICHIHVPLPLKACVHVSAKSGKFVALDDN